MRFCVDTSRAKLLCDRFTIFLMPSFLSIWYLCLLAAYNLLYKSPDSK